MYSTTDFRRGLKIEIDGTPYEIVEFQHFKPGKGGAMVRTKLRNILNGRVVDNTFRQRQGDPLAARFALTGLYGVLLEWAYTGFEASPAEMARKTARLFTQPLRQVLFVAAP